jgi:hypothetical protein
MKKVPFSKTRSVIAQELQVDRKTLRRMLRVNGINLPSGPVYLPWQKLIYETFSYPLGVKAKDFQDVKIAGEKMD